MDRETVLDSISKVQNNVNLKEGTHGLLKFIAVLDRFPSSPMQFVAQKIGLPVPICVAIRNEFEKIGWCKREKKGAILTDKGEEVITLLSKINTDFSCQNCTNAGLSFNLDDFAEYLSILEKYSELRGQPNTIIDQSYATPQTSLRRALLMTHNFDLLFDKYAFIGDSDLTSIALALLTPRDVKIVVFDIDEKVQEIINQANQDLALQIQFIEHDLREPIPEKYLDYFDCFLTDPPYTQYGLRLFVSRGLQLLSKKKNGILYLSFGTKPPKEMLAIQKDLTDMGCLITEIIPGFNEYVGAQKLGGISTIYRILVGTNSSPLISDSYKGSLYTGDLNPIIRTYVCMDCKTEYLVGKKQTF